MSPDPNELPQMECLDVSLLICQYQVCQWRHRWIAARSVATHHLMSLRCHPRGQDDWHRAWPWILSNCPAISRARISGSGACLVNRADISGEGRAAGSTQPTQREHPPDFPSRTALNPPRHGSYLNGRSAAIFTASRV